MKKSTLLITALSVLAVALSACGASAATSSAGSGPESMESAAAPEPAASSGPASSPASSDPERPPYYTISADDAKKMMDEGGVTIVDVRTAEEYAEKHVKDAINIPVESISDQQPEALPDKTAAILVYCRTGVRSARASKALTELGYENIYNFGGIVNWPYETE